jgi:hypothetical protein
MAFATHENKTNFDLHLCFHKLTKMHGEIYIKNPAKLGGNSQGANSSRF